MPMPKLEAFGSTEEPINDIGYDCVEEPTKLTVLFSVMLLSTWPRANTGHSDSNRRTFFMRTPTQRCSTLPALQCPRARRKWGPTACGPASPRVIRVSGPLAGAL